MADLVALNKIIDESGISKSHIAMKCDITRPSLYDKLNGKSKFNIDEVRALKNILHLSSAQVEDIFFT